MAKKKGKSKSIWMEQAMLLICIGGIIVSDGILFPIVISSATLPLYAIGIMVFTYVVMTIVFLNVGFRIIKNKWMK